MRELLFLVVLSLVAALILAPSVGAQQGVTVNMEDNYFDQANITVPQGTTVTWVQAGNYGHTTTSYDGLWDSGLIEGGSREAYSCTFDQPGTYTYYCKLHESLGMVGTVIVTAAPRTTSSDQQQFAATGGPSLLVPAAAVLLMASGVAGWAVLRRIA